MRSRVWPTDAFNEKVASMSDGDFYAHEKSVTIPEATLWATLGCAVAVTFESLSDVTDRRGLRGSHRDGFRDWRGLVEPVHEAQASVRVVVHWSTGFPEDARSMY